jgi:hypothetical protein
MHKEVTSTYNANVNHQRLSSELRSLYASFCGVENAPDADALLQFAETRLDFRSGRPREDTDWNEGDPLTLEQKTATLKVANSWNMLKTTLPTNTYDQLVILGAHKASLAPRIQHAVELQGEQIDQAGYIILSCFRPTHPKEEVDNKAIDTELDLAVDLLENGLEAPFEVESVSAWDDLPNDTERAVGEYAVAYIGHLGVHNATFISGSVPGHSSRATTISTLGSLRTYLDKPSLRLLFVTTSLHLPYQSIQISQVMRDFELEVVGVAYESLNGLSVESPDAKFRAVLQEIGATIKNYVRGNEL